MCRSVILCDWRHGLQVRAWAWLGGVGLRGRAAQLMCELGVGEIRTSLYCTVCQILEMFAIFLAFNSGGIV